MGQVALGVRSLLIRGAVFFVMAALLAWALGGTLWPRPAVVDYGAVSFDGREWFWRLEAGGREAGRARTMLMVREAGADPAPIDGRRWVEFAHPVSTADALYYAGRGSFNPNESWRIERIGRDGTTETYPMPDRLAVEQQLARVRAGLEIQDPDVIREQRPHVVDPAEERTVHGP
jgi:hypothetical protein